MIDPGLRDGIGRIMAWKLKQHRCRLIQVGMVDDHVHVLFKISRTQTVAEVIKLLKVSTSHWIKEQGDSHCGFYWQEGYGAFSVSESGIPAVRNYIANQEVHHRSMSFQTEFRALLRRHRLRWSESNVWD